jgi:6-pyruvoyltetrahydropterin/6-carboxytetrahydropterin synthase
MFELDFSFLRIKPYFYKKKIAMSKIRITKIFEFEMAHALWNYDGKCKNIHGHTFRLEVTVRGEPINQFGHPKNGMVLDFGILKEIVNKHIIEKHDHHFIFDKNSPYAQINYKEAGFELIGPKNYQPTSENLLMEFVQILKENLPPEVELYSVKLWETSNSFAEWNLDDNKN